MKKVFVYFGEKALCENAQQAEAFINTLRYRGNGGALSCNDHCRNLLRRIFDGEELPRLTTTGCGNTFIECYPALGDTIEAHEREYARRLAIQRAERIALNKARLRTIDRRLNAFRPGQYTVSLSYRHLSFAGASCEPRWVEDVAHMTVSAQSARDAYRKSVESISEEHPDAECAAAHSDTFTYEFSEK